MNADAWFTIGSTHKVCEDYAISLSDDFIIVSDGCSSARHSDYGARLLARSAVLCRWQLDNPLHFKKLVADESNFNCNALRLNADCLCATLLAASVEKDHFITLTIGDGVVAAFKKDGTILAHEYHFESGAPYYLRYELDKGKKEGYFQEFGNVVTKRTVVITPNGVESETVSQPFDEDHISFDDKFPISDWDGVAIMSDGAFSFVESVLSTTSKQNNKVDTATVYKEMLGFKTYSGEFVHRRVQRAIKDFQARNIQHTDDFSMGVILK